MKLYLTSQSKYFSEHLKFLKEQDIIHYNISQLTEKITSIPIDTAKSIKELDLTSFFDYKIFPDNIMIYLTEWSYEKREMKVGDTIVQQAFIPPFHRLSQKMIFGVRINKIIHETSRIGYSYETIRGHVEKGISTFTFEMTSNNKVIFKIHTFSKPANLLARIAGPILSVPYQTFCTKQGLKNVASRF